MTEPICRECREGKHGACNGDVILEWDDDSIRLVRCTCKDEAHAH